MSRPRYLRAAALSVLFLQLQSDALSLRHSHTGDEGNPSIQLVAAQSHDQVRYTVKDMGTIDKLNWIRANDINNGDVVVGSYHYFAMTEDLELQERSYGRLVKVS